MGSVALSWAQYNADGRTQVRFRINTGTSPLCDPFDLARCEHCVPAILEAIEQHCEFAIADALDCVFAAANIAQGYMKFVDQSRCVHMPQRRAQSLYVFNPHDHDG